MQNQQSLKLLFVINPVSGGKEKNSWEASIREIMNGSIHKAEFYILNGQNDKRSVQHHITQIQPDRVVAVGGDGTVKMIAELLMETNIPLAIIPAGSANGMARELNISNDVSEAMEVALNGEQGKIDVIRINEKEICIHLSDIGLNALLVKYFENSSGRGMWGYGRAIFRMLWEKRKMRVTITTDDGTVKRFAYMVALANARKYGTGANINPDGDVSDGKFEVVVVRKINLLEIFKSVFTDRSFHPHRIEVFSTSTLKMQVHRKAYFQVDGEFMGKITEINARIMPRMLNIMLPVGRVGSR